MLKILHITDYSMTGGIEAYVKEIIELEKIEHEVDICILNLKNNYLKLEKTNFIDLTKYNIFQKVLEIKKIIKNNKYDLIYVHSLKSKIFVSFLKIKNLNVNYIEHGVYFGRRRYLQMIRRFIFNKIIYKYPKKIICVQKIVEKSIINTFPELSSKTITIENGINLTKFKFSYNPKIKEKRKIIGVTARLVQEKGIDILIEALSLLGRRDIKLKIIGTGIFEKELLKLVKERKLEEIIEFLGERNDVNDILQEIDFYIQPSRIEGFGLALLEAIAMGIPVIISDIDAFKSLIKLDNYEYFFESGNAQELCRKINKMLNEECQTLEELSYKLRKIAENYSIENTVIRLHRECLINE